MVSRVQILSKDHIAWIVDLWNEEQDNQTPYRFTPKKRIKSYRNRANKEKNQELCIRWDKGLNLARHMSPP